MSEKRIISLAVLIIYFQMVNAYGYELESRKFVQGVSVSSTQNQVSKHDSNTHFRTLNTCSSSPCFSTQTCCMTSSGLFSYCFDLQNAACCTYSNGYPYACKEGWTCYNNGYCQQQTSSISGGAVAGIIIAIIFVCCIAPVAVFLIFCGGMVYCSQLFVRNHNNQPSSATVIPVVYPSSSQPPNYVQGYVIDDKTINTGAASAPPVVVATAVAY